AIRFSTTAATQTRPTHRSHDPLIARQAAIPVVRMPTRTPWTRLRESRVATPQIQQTLTINEFKYRTISQKIQIPGSKSVRMAADRQTENRVATWFTAQR